MILAPQGKFKQVDLTLLEHFSQTLCNIAHFVNDRTFDFERVSSLIQALTNDRINGELTQQGQVITLAKIGNIRFRWLEYGRCYLALWTRKTRHILDYANHF